MCDRFLCKFNKNDNNCTEKILSKSKKYVLKHISSVKTSYLRERFIPISKTLEALFKNDDFKSMFIEYNDAKNV